VFEFRARNGEIEFETGIAKFDLSVEAFEDDESDSLRFEYNTDLFEKQTILRKWATFATW